MVTRRPTLEQISARKYEIAKRYRRKAAKVGKRTRSMAAIRLAELTRWLHDAYGQGVELDATESGYALVRVFAHHLGALPDAPRRITKWTDTYAPWIDPKGLEILIGEVVSCPLKYTADTLAWKIGLKDAKRTELKIRTIGAVDCSKDQRKARRKELNTARRRQRRAELKAQSVRSI
jgi:hypothetical protein